VSEHTASDRASRGERWLAQRRVKAALAIGVGEGILAAVGGISSWVVIGVAIPTVLIYILHGRSLEFEVGRQLAWVAAASQSVAVLVVLLVPVIALLILIIVALLAIAVLVLLYRGQAEQSSSSQSSPASALPDLTEEAHTKPDDPIVASQPIIAISGNGNADSAGQPATNHARETGKADHQPPAGIPAQTTSVETSTVTHTDSPPPVAEEQTGVFTLIGLPHIPI
jgi:hypothetical protein